ncbi:hypothetical protein BDQ17DRAFT_1269571 [Cyathus striatus]|nr:hypothetical protein BDQ17DRAFT_1269571 [Cyathus striatus]
MTSRVQKGGTVFRPIAKSKPRQTPTPRQQSTAPLDQKLSAGQSSSPLAGVPLSESGRAESSADAVDVSSAGNASLNEISSSQLPRAATTLPVQKVSKSTPALITVSQIRPSKPNAPTDTSPHSLSSTVEGSHSVSNNPTQALSSSSLNLPAHSIPLVIPHLPPSERDSEPLRLERKQRSDSHINHENGSSALEKPGKNDSSREVTKRKRKRSAPKTSEGAEDTSDNATIKAKKLRASSDSGSRLRRSRAPSLPPYDPDADPGDEIDPTVITMATLCEDTGQGRVSSKAVEILSNHAAWKAKNREKRAHMKVLMEAKKYGREEDDENSPKDPSGSGGASNNGEPESSNLVSEHNGGDNENGFDYSQDIQTSRFNVQVRIGPNGETIIDEESLVVDRAEADDTLQYTHVTESDTTKFVNSGTYSKRYRGSRWSVEETELFYNALSQYGENYELIAYVLPGRDRKSCKNKFKAEDKKNHARINFCLNNRIPVDMKTLSRMTGKDFTGPVPDIRPLTPVPILANELDSSTSADQDDVPVQTEVKKRRNKKAVSNDGVVIVGDVDTYDT